MQKGREDHDLKLMLENELKLNQQRICELQIELAQLQLNNGSSGGEVNAEQILTRQRQLYQQQQSVTNLRRPGSNLNLAYNQQIYQQMPQSPIFFPRQQYYQVDGNLSDSDAEVSSLFRPVTPMLEQVTLNWRSLQDSDVQDQLALEQLQEESEPSRQSLVENRHDISNIHEKDDELSSQHQNKKDQSKEPDQHSNQEENPHAENQDEEEQNDSQQDQTDQDVDPEHLDLQIDDLDQSMTPSSIGTDLDSTGEGLDVSWNILF